MSDAPKEIAVNIDDWISKAKADPEAYFERQATEVFLTTLANMTPYCDQFFLKGGILMGLTYHSPRQTGDLDFSTTLDPDPAVIQSFESNMDTAFPRFAATLGYPDLLCKIQKTKYRPKPENFTQAQAPALQITIGYAKRGSAQEAKLNDGRAAKVLSIDISFNEPIGGIQILKIGEKGTKIPAYSLDDMIAEKYRALLQQEIRNRYRRQDVYDLDMLISQFPFDENEIHNIHQLLLEKCRAREIEPTVNSIENPQIIKRAKSEWETLKQEIGELPDFDECYKRIAAFYKSLPW